jgi:hypothetical protein
MLRPSVIWMLLPAIAASAAAASAQGLSPSQAPIEIHVGPATVAPGDSVAITGATMVGGKQHDITIAVTPPQGPAVMLTPHTSSEGAFATRFGATSAIGTYRVTATAIDGKGTATDSFAVLTLSGMVEQQATALSELHEALTDANTALSASVKATPPSPPQQEALQRTQELGAQLAEAPQRIGTYRQALGEIAKLGDQHPILRAPLRPVFDSLNAQARRARQYAPQLRAHLAASKKAADLCDDLALAQEGLTAMGYALNLSGGFFKAVYDLAAGYGFQKLTDYLAGASGSAMAKSSATTAMDMTFSLAKQHVHKDPVNIKFWSEKSLGLANSLGQIVGGGLFDAYCEKFEGPVTALLHVDFLHRGTAYLKYDVQLTGRMEVHYERTKQAGTPAALNGFIEGNATGFRLWDNTSALDETGVCRRMMCFHLDAVPPTSLFFESIGLVARQATLNYFLIRIGGQYADGTVTLEIRDARQDFGDWVHGQILYLGYAGIIPEFFKVSVPFQKARFILAKGMRDTPAFPVSVDQKAKVSRIGRTFTREERRGGAEGVVVTLKVDTEACNPKCP